MSNRSFSPRNAVKNVKTLSHLCRPFTLIRHLDEISSFWAAPIRLNTDTLQQQKSKSHIQGLRAVAVLEIAKGVGAVLFGIWLLSFRDKDIGDMMANLLDRLHVDPAHEIAIKLVSMADRITPEKVVMAALIAFAYAIIRFTEGYGLWNARTWAEYFALISGAAYLPWELWEFLRRPNWFHATLIVINVIVVLYIAYVRVQVHHEHAQQPPPLSAG